MISQKDRVAQFRDAHTKGSVLVLPNAWDAASARMAADAGAKAVATSSAAVAWCHGYADGETMPRDVVMTATKEVLRVVDLPVTVDSEAGYSDDPAKVAAHVVALIDLGVAGINIEDGEDEPGLLVAKIEAIKAAAKARGADIFVNARSDVYLQNLVPDDAKLKEIIRRGVIYRDVGADGFFAPAVTALSDIRAVVDAVDLPVNILMMRAVPPIPEMKAAGVRRISTGALIGRAAYGKAVKAIRMLLDDGKPDAIFETSGDCPDFNKAFG
jgi:2-methylisocitrate lyase-like PEP mutase family enzyme